MTESLYAEVAVIAGQRARGTFTYAVPEGTSLERGMAVAVPWRDRFAAGIVMSVGDEAVVAEPKQIVRVLQERPLLDRARLELAAWMSARYLAPISDCAAPFLPPGAPRRAVADASRIAGLLPRPKPGAMLLRSALDGDALATAIREWPRSKRSRPAELLSLLARGAWTLGRARRIAGGPAALARWTSPLVERDGDAYVLAVPASEALDAADSLRRTAAERRRVALLRVLAERGAQEESALRAAAGATRADVDRLEAGGWIERVPAPPAEPPDPIGAPVLTPAQSSAAGEIIEAVERAAAARRAGSAESAAFLLHGVTGSGKTEVYLAAAARALAAGGGVLALVPEIALAPQTVRRFEARFPGLVAVQHSQMKRAEAREAWRRVADSEVRVLVGARSALFAPLRGLSLIIVDEAHEWTYKQSDASPRYDARDAARELARLAGAVVVFGTATPPASMHRDALGGCPRRLVLSDRVRADAAAPSGFSAASEPPIDVVDLRAELRAGNRSAISRTLAAAISEALDRGGQALLFLNRRGAGAVICRACGAAVECGRCAIAMTAHARGAWLECHGCGARRGMPGRCPSCGDARLRPMRFGTEQLEAEVRERWAGAGVARWDRDTARAPGGHERILDEFASGRARVLVGTQMIAKGLDLPGVAVAGVINADLALRAPDFAAAERAFQLITQVAGRAGRGELEGRVVVQTYSPDHPVIAAAAARDYDGFAESELRARARFDYPPFGRLALLRCSHRNPETAEEAAAEMAERLRRERQYLPSPPEVLGPMPARPQRLRGMHRRQIILRGPDPAPLLQGIDLDRRWTLDIDPVSIA